MAVAVERHHDRLVAEQLLHHLGRQLAAAALLWIDAPAGKEVAEGVQGVFRPAMLVHYASRDKNWRQPAQQVGVKFDAALRGREYQAELADGAGQLPRLEGAQQVGSERDHAPAGCRFRTADRFV